MKREPTDHIRQVIADALLEDVSVCSDAARLVEDLGADEMEVMQVVEAIEERFGLDVDEETFDTFKTVGDVIAHVTAHPTT